MNLFRMAFLLSNIIFSLQDDDAEGDGDITFTILHTGNLHGFVEEPVKGLGGMPRIISFIKKERKSDITTLYFDTGDMYRGSLWYRIHKGKVVKPFYELLKPEAMCFGERELHDKAPQYEDFIKTTNITVLCCNCDFRKEPLLNGLILPHIKLKVQEREIGIIGYLTHNARKLGRNLENLVVTNEVNAITAEVKKLRDENVNIIILLSHSGIEIERDVIQNTDDIDVLIGGHSMTLLHNGELQGTLLEHELLMGDYPMIVKSRKGKDVPILEGFKQGLVVGKFTMTFDKEGIMKNMTGNTVIMNKDIKEDKTALRILKTYETEVLTFRNEVVGKCRVDLLNTCVNRECNIANLMTDSWIDNIASQHNGAGWTDTPLAIVNAHAFQKSLTNFRPPDRNISLGDIMDASPYNNNILKIAMKGALLRQIIEYSVANDTMLDRKFLQYSGIRVRINYEREPGHLVESIRVRCGKCDPPSYSDLKDSERYQVAMSDFVYGGGATFTMIQNNSEKVDQLSEAQNFILKGYIEKYGVITPQADERIVIIAAPKSRKNNANIMYSTHNKVVILTVIWALPAVRLLKTIENINKIEGSLFN